MKKKISITIDDSLLKEVDRIIDNIYIRNRSQAIEHLIKNAVGENRNAVILAGGDPKDIEIAPGIYAPVTKVGKYTVIEQAIRKLRKNGFKNIFIISRHKVLTKIFSVIKDGSTYGININYIEEKNTGGTADSLRLIKGKITTRFLVVYGDIIFNKVNINDIWDDHIKHNVVATIMLVTCSKPSEKGTVKLEGNRVIKFMQKPRRSDTYLVFSPIFVTEPEILEYEGKSLEKDIFPMLAEQGLLNGYHSSEREIHIHKKGGQLS